MNNKKAKKLRKFSTYIAKTDNLYSEEGRQPVSFRNEDGKDVNIPGVPRRLDEKSARFAYKLMKKRANKKYT